MRKHLLATAMVAVLIVLGIFLFPTSSSRAQSHSPRNTAVVHDPASVQPVAATIAAGSILANYLTAIQESEQAFLAFLSSHPLPPPPVQVTPEIPVASGSGACGGATNGADQYISRETNGSSDPVNQENLDGSGAWGCYQIMPGTWASSCDDLGPEIGSDGGTQAKCASRLSLSNWGG
jgi:hypothetical protein